MQYIMSNSIPHGHLHEALCGVPRDISYMYPKGAIDCCLPKPRSLINCNCEGSSKVVALADKATKNVRIGESH